jgi:very-short-patch-repair endonuclease
MSKDAQGDGLQDPSPFQAGGNLRPTRPTRIKKSRVTSPIPSSVARLLRKRMTPQEVKLWVKLRQLRPAGFHFRRQVPIGRFVVDFACLKRGLVIELDGGQHNFDGHAARDRARDAHLREIGFQVLRFWNANVDADLDGVVETILARISPALNPTPVAAATRPSPEGEG